MASPTYRVEIRDVDGAVVRIGVTAANNSDQTIPTERRFPFLVACEAFQVMSGRARFKPDGWRMPPDVNAATRTADHPHGDALAAYSFDDVWIYEEMERDFHHGHLIEDVTVENLGTESDEGDDSDFGRRATGEVVCRFSAADVVRHLVPGTSWYIYWW